MWHISFSNPEGSGRWLGAQPVRNTERFNLQLAVPSHLLLIQEATWATHCLQCQPESQWDPASVDQSWIELRKEGWNKSPIYGELFMKAELQKPSWRLTHIVPHPISQSGPGRAEQSSTPSWKQRYVLRPVLEVCRVVTLSQTACHYFSSSHPEQSLCLP